MRLPNEGKFHGTEGLSWGDACCPGIDSGGIPRKNNKGEWFEAITCWGQVYVPREGSTAANTRYQIRNMDTKILRKDGTWLQVQSGDPSGAAYVENFADNASIDADARDESSNGDGMSVILGIGPWAGYNFHFWATPRASVDINNIVAVYTSCEARLIIDDPDKLDDRSICKNLLNMGGDWWLNLSIGCLPDWSANSGIGAKADDPDHLSPVQIDHLMPKLIS
jgi:hypothetical protein